MRIALSYRNASLPATFPWRRRQEQGCLYPGKSEQHTPFDVRVALPLGVGWWVGVQNRDLFLVEFEKMNKIMMVKRATSFVAPVELTWTYQSRRVTAVRIAYNALEVVPVDPDARRYFPP